MITIQEASIYSVTNKGGMAYQLTYSDGTNVRSVKQAGNIIRTEYKDGGSWKQSAKPYIVTKDKQRNAERIVASVEEFLK